MDDVNILAQTKQTAEQASGSRAEIPQLECLDCDERSDRNCVGVEITYEETAWF